MLTHGYATTEMQRAMATAFDQLHSQPDKAFHYGAVRLICRTSLTHEGKA